jgi:hypothetical protein
MKIRMSLIVPQVIEGASTDNRFSISYSKEVYDESDNRRLITEHAVNNLLPTQELYLGR